MTDSHFTPDFAGAQAALDALTEAFPGRTVHVDIGLWNGPLYGKTTVFYGASVHGVRFNGHCVGVYQLTDPAELLPALQRKLADELRAPQPPAEEK